MELTVARTFVKVVQERIVGSVVHTKVKGKSGNMQADPAQHFVHICHEELVNLMGPVDTSINYQTPKGGPCSHHDGWFARCWKNHDNWEISKEVIE